MVDVAIVGFGCAGYTAAIYCARYKLSTLIIGAEEGGMGMAAAEVGNWPGTINITGPDLMENFKKHALSFEGVTHRIARVGHVGTVSTVGTVGDGGGFVLVLENGERVEARTVILALGTKKRHLGIKGEKEFSGKGVTYCATCDAYFYKGKDVAVVGGGDSAVEGAAIAAQVARRVYMIHRRKEFRAEPYWVDRVRSRDNVVLVLERNVVEILGKGKVTGVRLDTPFDGKDILPLDGVFIEVGADPASDLAKEAGCALDAKGYVRVDAAQATTVPGLFAAGDITTNSNYFAQFTTAAGEATVAANSAFKYLQGSHLR
ncbi:FAD-dependent oxidoreductase [Candidatus Peregrinibacteria bacterium]|nr:FAD-dependent oxidoreductase [Candidatus Peregrinibacteria bacterium]